MCDLRKHDAYLHALCRIDTSLQIDGDGREEVYLEIYGMYECHLRFIRLR